MSETEYCWMIVYENGTTEQICAAYLECVIDEIGVKDDGNVIAIIRVGSSFFGRFR